MRTVQAILAFTLLTLALAAGRRDPCRRAFRECAWEFMGLEGKIPAFPVNTLADRAFTPRIVSKDAREIIGVLNTNGVIPEFITRKGPKLITKFGHPRFTPTHFKPFTIQHIMGSGVGHQTFQGNQKHVARGQCVRVFFTTFQRLGKGHPMPVVNNINVDRHDFKCVVFRLY